MVKRRLIVISYYYLVHFVALRRYLRFATIIIPAVISVKKLKRKVFSQVQVYSPVLLNLQVWLKKVHDLGVISVRNVWKFEKSASNAV